MYGRTESSPLAELLKCLQTILILVSQPLPTWQVSVNYRGSVQPALGQRFLLGVLGVHEER